MATANVVLTAAWTKVADDAAWNLISTSRQLQQDMGDGIEVATAASAPAATFRGHPIAPGGGVTVDVLGVGDVWARALPYGRSMTDLGGNAATVVLVVS